MKKIIVNAGEIFCIPLFMPKDDWKLKTKLSDEDLDKDFAFGRVIETSSSVLVEIFKKIGSAKTSISEIEGSDILFSPLQIFWDGVIKKRWRIIGKTENYDKYKHSDYDNLKMIFKGVNTKSTKHIYNNYLNNNYLLKKRKNTKSTIACI